MENTHLTTNKLAAIFVNSLADNFGFKRDYIAKVAEKVFKKPVCIRGWLNKNCDVFIGSRDKSVTTEDYALWQEVCKNLVTHNSHYTHS